MKKAVAIRHVNFENLGILGSLLSLRGYQIDYYDAGRDDIRAINNEETDLLVVLGGPISTFPASSGMIFSTMNSRWSNSAWRSGGRPSGFASAHK
ncbi:hypothetical protein SME10J_18650 [Serratia marcescens]|nr:hypothetical protein SME10J_18650 [Serratia marcescens]